MKHKVKTHMKHHVTKHHYKKGGSVPKVLHGDAEEFAEAEGKKRGGKVAHKAHGKKPHHRLDKKARGGKIMTPKSPLSGAAPNKMRPGFGENKLDKEDD
jgi:hypothetical protein